MADIFISYAKEDYNETRLLAALLEAEGYSVWWDTNLVSGDQFRKVIMTELGRARAVIVVWTENSINSDWVHSEAGRAHADRKLIPVKTKGLAYTDIPPPFDNMHIENVGARDKILGAVVAKLAEPVEQGLSVARLSKGARYQLLSWFGIVGAAVSLAANLQGLVALANWTKLLLGSWVSTLTFVWQHVLFFLPKIYETDALVLTFVSFAVVNMVVSSEARGVSRPNSKRKLLSVVVASVLVLAIFVSGLAQVTSAVKGQVPGLYPDFARFLNDRLGGVAELIQDQLSVRTSTAVYLLAILCGALYLLVCYAVLPLMPFALAYLLVARMAGIKLNMAALSRRLWRVVAGVVLIVALNYLTLWIERHPWSG